VHDQTQLEPLLAATGGNPKAITMVAGLLKYERRPLQQIMDDLYAARGDLFDDLFSRAWALLDEAGKRILMVMTFFPDSASVEALSATADVTGFDFDRATERLTDLSLLDVQQENLTSEPRYVLHPLVRSFVAAQLVEQTDFEKAARERWVGWYVDLSSQVGYCWDALHKLELIDLEQETMYTAIIRTYDTADYNATLQIARGVEVHFFVRGFWHRKMFWLQAAEAARNVSDTLAELLMLSNFVQISSMQGTIIDAEPHLARLQELAEITQLPGDTLFEFQHAMALMSMAHQDIEGAQKAWDRCQDRRLQISHNSDLCSRYWLGLCDYQKGATDKALQIFTEILEDANQQGFLRPIIFSECQLSNIFLDYNNIVAASETLLECSRKARGFQDREILAQIQCSYARLHTLRSNLPAAHSSLLEAIDLFERMGMRRELAEAREELARLEAQIAEAAE
jgi:tetratricopeptide (TPR) repeat protein